MEGAVGSSSGDAGAAVALAGDDPDFSASLGTLTPAFPELAALEELVERPGPLLAGTASARFRLGFAGWRPSAVLFWVAVLVGIALRVRLADSHALVENSDMAIVHLIAVHAAHGHFRAFFWGQPYGGTLLQVTAAPLIWLFGDHLALLMSVEAGYFLLATLVLRRLVTRLWSPTAGDVAGIVFWLPGGVLIIVSVMDPGFYGPALLFGLLSLLMALSPNVVTSRRHAALLGLAMGVAIWMSPDAAAFVLPALALVLRRWYRAPEETSWQQVPLLVGSGLVGGLPWLVNNAHSGFSSLLSRGEPAGAIPARILTDFTVVVPTAVDFNLHWPVRAAVGVVLVATLYAAVRVAIRQRRLDRLAFASTAVLGVLVLASAVEDLDPATFRYTMYLAPVLAGVVGATTAGPRWRNLVGCLLTATIVGWSAWGVLEVPAGTLPNNVSPAITSLVTALNQRGIHALYADYWIAYDVDVATHEKTIAASLLPRRYGPYEKVAAAAPHTVIAVYTGDMNEASIEEVSQEPHGGLPTFTTFQSGPYTVFVFNGNYNPFNGEDDPHSLVLQYTVY